MIFAVSHVEPGEKPGQIVAAGEYRQHVRVIVDLEPEIAARVKPNVNGIQEQRITDAIAASVAEAVKSAAGSRDLARNLSTGSKPDNSAIGKVDRGLSGQQLPVTPARPEPAAPEAPRARGAHGGSPGPIGGTARAARR